MTVTLALPGPAGHARTGSALLIVFERWRDKPGDGHFALLRGSRNKAFYGVIGRPVISGLLHVNVTTMKGSGEAEANQEMKEEEENKEKRK